MSIEKKHTQEWMRCIISAGGDENVAQQAVALAALNGLFDLHRGAEKKQDGCNWCNPGASR